MQPTTRFHDGIANSVFQEASLVFHNEIERLATFSGGVSSPPRGFFLGWTIDTFNIYHEA